jgi:D-alanyl-D-alanine carboxypeptidase/D-alanyl-D-alanine-endopeptidase (penicillin-binding protein 4)
MPFDVLSRVMRVSRVVVVVAAVVVVGGAVAGYVVTRSPSTSGSAAAAPSPTSSPTPSLTPSAVSRTPVLLRAGDAAPEPSPAAVSRRLAVEAAVAMHGARLIGQVVDASTGKQLWARGAGASAPPASTTKLLTALAALTTLGPRHRLTTSTRRVGDTVYLVGGGDPTLSLNGRPLAAVPYPAPASMAALAHHTAAELGHTRRVHLRLDTSAWSGPRLARGWKPRYVTEGDVTPPSALELNEGRAEADSDEEFAPRAEDPAAEAGAAFADLLRADGVHVVGPVREAATPATARGVAAVRSAQVDQLVQRMLTVSDDDLAEALGRAVAIATGYPPTFAGAAAAVTARAGQLGVSTKGMSLQDTSGLSRLDRVTPRALTAVLRLSTGRDQATLQSMVEGLPVAGSTGTLALRYLEPPTSSAAGVLRAKTGTLKGVNTLSGLVLDRGGRLLAFAFLASNEKSSNLTVPRIDRLAAELQGCGCLG